tara:strand:- start:474 stop:971 length:498 start_codon:yes stop_codon:yes gene_type:complete
MPVNKHAQDILNVSTMNEGFSNQGEYKRLTAQERATNKLRPSNKNLGNLLNQPAPPQRPHNTDAMSKLREYPRTLYPEENVFRPQNLALSSGMGHFKPRVFRVRDVVREDPETDDEGEAEEEGEGFTDSKFFKGLSKIGRGAMKVAQDPLAQAVMGVAAKGMLGI